MRIHVLQYGARLAIRASRAMSPRCMQPKVMGPAEIKATKEAIRKFIDGQFHAFGILDNWYTRDDIRWQWWNELAEEKRRKIAAQGHLDPTKRICSGVSYGNV